jgi:hypothetical protein
MGAKTHKPSRGAGCPGKAWHGPRKGGVRARESWPGKQGTPGHGGAWESGRSGARGQDGRQKSRGAEKRPARGCRLPHAPRPGRKSGRREWMGGGRAQAGPGARRAAARPAAAQGAWGDDRPVTHPPRARALGRASLGRRRLVTALGGAPGPERGGGGGGRTGSPSAPAPLAEPRRARRQRRRRLGVGRARDPDVQGNGEGGRGSARKWGRRGPVRPCACAARPLRKVKPGPSSPPSSPTPRERGGARPETGGPARPKESRGARPRHTRPRPPLKGQHLRGRRRSGGCQGLTAAVNKYKLKKRPRLWANYPGRRHIPASRTWRGLAPGSKPFPSGLVLSLSRALPEAALALGRLPRA